MKTYLAVYFSSLCLALITTPAVILVARRLKALDRPGIRTVHTRPIPRIGGVAIFLAATCVLVSVIFLDNEVGTAFRDIPIQLGTLLSTATAIFVIGLIDDLKGLPARVKFLVEAGAAGALCYAGVIVRALEITDNVRLELGWAAFPLTIVWIVGITNAVNLSDGLDGLAAGVSAVACAAIAIFAVSSQNLIMAVFMLTLLGGLTGFLFFNFNPAKIFMGDCGSLFVGFTIASASVMCLTKSCALVGLALPILALGIPIFDTLFAMLRRFLERRSLFAPDRSHFHHRLIDLGLHQRHAVVAIYIATCVATGLGLFMMMRRDVGSLLVFGCLLLLLVLLFRVVGEVQVKATVEALQGKYLLARREKQERRVFEDLQLRFRRAQDPTEWWQAVCDAGQGLGFAWVSMTVRYEDGRLDTRVWRGKSPVPKAANVVTMGMPIATFDRRISVECEIAIVVAESLESASRRGALFSRLMDEQEFAGDVVAAFQGEPSVSARDRSGTYSLARKPLSASFGIREGWERGVPG